MRATVATALSVLALCTLLSAQHGAEARLTAPGADPAQLDRLHVGPGQGTEALPGRLPGTRRYNVTFRTRSFDLREFRDAVRWGQPAEVVEAIVRDLELRARLDQEPFRRAIEELGGRMDFQFWLINACTIEIAPEDLQRVRGMDNVLFVHPDLETFPLGPAAAPMIRISTNSNNHNADAERALGNTGTGWSVAIVDTSQDDNYQNAANTPHRTYYRDGDRSNKTAGGIDGSRLLGNYQIGTQAANNTHLHGTGVASIAAGSNWGTSQAGHGHAHDAGIVGYAICNAWPSCSSSHATQAAAWQRVAADKVRYSIVSANMSYGSSPDPTNVSQQAVDALALNADVLPVTAAGNSSSSTTGSSSTANGLAVGAVNANTKTMASFSSRGPLSGDTQRFFPDIAANGVSTIMARVNDESANYTGSGTSMAAPQVAGAAVLVKGARPASTALEIKAVLLCSTEDISAQNPTRDRNAYGMGYLRDDLACQQVRRADSVLSDTIDSTAVPKSFSLRVTANQQVSVALAWHRHVLTSRNWSDLNLRVLDGTTVVAESATPRNLYEVVRFASPVTGALIVEVSAASLEVTPLPFALATDAELGPPGVRQAEYEFYGQGCPGSNPGGPAGCITLPAAQAGAFGNSANLLPFAWEPVTFQQVFLGEELRGNFNLTALRLRQDENFQGWQGHTVDLEIALGYTTFDPDTITGTFASNFNSGPKVTVVPRANVRLPDMPGTPATDPNQFFITLPFATPFAYSLAPGRNLLIEVVNRGNSNNNSFFIYPLDAATGTTTTQVSGTGATGSLLRGSGLVMCFQTSGGGVIPRMAAEGRPVLDRSFSVDLSWAVANTAGLLFLGVSSRDWLGTPLPLDLGPLGAPGCSILAAGDLVQGVAVDASGSARVTYGLPNDSSLLGSAFFQQFLVHDPAANSLEWAVTRAGRGIVGDY